MRGNKQNLIIFLIYLGATTTTVVTLPSAIKFRALKQPPLMVHNVSALHIPQCNADVINEDHAMSAVWLRACATMATVSDVAYTTAAHPPPSTRQAVHVCMSAALTEPPAGAPSLRRLPIYRPFVRRVPSGAMSHRLPTLSLGSGHTP